LIDPPPDPPAGPAAPVFDPLHAQRSIDIGTFYLKKGIYDAAIERFVDATNYQPTLATPWKLLGETYEKKHEYPKALEAYNKYLQILPRAPDAAKIKKTIADLEEKTAESTKKDPQ
jgi:tetratricopeptide (TPR) repeat protein